MKPKQFLSILIIALLIAWVPLSAASGSSHASMLPSLTQSSAGSCSPVNNTITYTFVNGDISLDGSPAPVGTVVEAKSPRGDVVGCSIVSTSGQFGYMTVFGEWTTYSPPIPGMRTGETIAFYVNNNPATATPALTWADDRDFHSASLAAITIVPTITTLSPSSANAGGSAFTLTVSGTRLSSSSVVRWNGVDRTTTYVSASQLTAAIAAADIASAGTFPVTVFNPCPGGCLSYALNFTVNNPSFSLTVIKVGNGTVTKDPDKTSYQNNEVVTLVATADPGWTFTSWTGCTGPATGCPLVITGNTTVTATFTQNVGSLLPGIADDFDALWSYSGNWGTWTGSGPYVNTIHDSNTIGDTAQIVISGSQQIKLTYMEASNRGVTDVYIDNAKVASIDANSSNFSWQKTWSSDLLTTGLHTVRFVHASGAVTDIDAIEALATYVAPPSLLPGIADDMDTLWKYSGDWAIWHGSGPYSDTIHDSNTIGDSAQIAISGGQQIKLTYVLASNRGVIDVYIDGVKVASINAYSPGFTWQSTWSSDILTTGPHTVRFVHASGNYTDLDAIQVFATAPSVGPGTADDNDALWNYSGDWMTWTGSGPASNTLHYSSTIGDSAQIAISGGQQIKLTYVLASNRGVTDVYIDGVKVASINAYSAGFSWQKTWSSDILSTGLHIVRLVHASGNYTDLDAIQVFATAPSVGPGTADDNDALWNYNGDWMTWTGSGPASNTLHYSTTIGDSAQIVVSGGQQIKLTYLVASNRGVTDVYIDGVKVASINAYSAGFSWQKTWSSDILTTGLHTVRLEHASGAYTDLDAIEVLANPPGVLPGTADDSDALWSYSGDWGTINMTGPYSNTLHYSSAIGDSAQIVVSGGQQIKLTYLVASNRGVIDVYIDGVKVTSIDAFSPGFNWQKTWSSDILTTGLHNVRFVHASGAYTDIDAIEVLATYTAPPALLSGTADDGNALWSYEGYWGTYNGAGPYSNTLHTSYGLGDYAQIVIGGGQKFKVTYYEAPNRGAMDVYLDGVKISTIDANKPSETWQKTWTSDVLTTGLHVVRFVHASGAYIDIDAITLIP